MCIRDRSNTVWSSGLNVNRSWGSVEEFLVQQPIDVLGNIRKEWRSHCKSLKLFFVRGRKQAFGSAIDLNVNQLEFSQPLKPRRNYYITQKQETDTILIRCASKIFRKFPKKKYLDLFHLYIISIL